jgi:serine/threonine-protein kinase
VVDTTLDAARARLEGAGLQVGRIEERTDAKPRGTVLEQSPEAGTAVRRGAAVDLTVSDGPELVAVPKLVGLAVATARRTLEGVGLAVGSVTEKDSDQQAGRVLSTDPPSDAEVATGSRVNLVVASGKTGVPYVVGRDRDDAEAVLERAGFTVDVRRQDTPDRDQDGVVIAQDPNGGGAEPGSTVTITVGNYERRASPSPTDTAPSPTATDNPPATSAAVPPNAPPTVPVSPTPTLSPTPPG